MRFPALILIASWLTLLGGCVAMPDEPATAPPTELSPTLDFFGLRPDMTVVEIWPGNGRHTAQIAAALNGRGQLYVATLDPTAGDYADSAVASFRARLALQPPPRQPTLTRLGSAPTARQVAPAGSADMALTFNTLHQWMMLGLTDTALAAIHTALKPGGVFGIVGHRDAPGAAQDPKAASGYVSEAHAIALIEAAGFRLSDSSQLNANPRDHHHHAKGVWSLPPTYAAGNVAEHQAIGVSDRFTLKFVKISP